MSWSVHWSAGLPLVIVCLGCVGEKGGDGDTGPTDAGPCLDGGWGELGADGPGVIHVQADAIAGDGSSSAPYGTMDEALDALRADATLHTLFVWPGSIAAGLTLSTPDGASADSYGVAVLGCGVDESTLVAADDTAPVILASDLASVRLAGLAVQGGTRAIWLRNVAASEMSHLSLVESRRAGIVLQGSDVPLVPGDDGLPPASHMLEDIAVADLVSESVETGEYGSVDLAYGLLVLSDASVSARELSVTGATLAGVLVHDAALQAVDLVISDTLASDALGVGRALQSQSGAWLSVSSSTLAQQVDAGLMAIDTFTLLLDALQVEATAAPSGAAGLVATGDGVVARAGDDGLYPPEYLTAALSEVVVVDSARAGVVLDAVTAELAGIDVSGSGGAECAEVCAQGAAVLSGETEGVETLDTPLSFNQADLVGADLEAR